MNEGKIIQVIGPVVDIDFSDGKLPAILNAVKIPRKNIEGVDEELVCEVQQHLGEERVRTVAMDSTDGLVRGMTAVDLGAPIQVPVGPSTLGRLINVIGEGIDNLPKINGEKRYSIHRSPPAFEN